MKKLFEIIFFSMVCMAMTFVHANELKKADSLYDQGKIKDALEIYLKPENNTNAMIQNRLGNLYLKEGFRDDKKSAEWFKKSAEQGNRYGQYNLGLSYQGATGVKRDYKKALQLFQQSAAQGHPDSMNAIGILYENGRGVEKNEIEAERWYAKAVDGGSVDGMCNATGLLMHGKVVRKDYAYAHKLLNRCLNEEPDNICCLDRMAELYSMGWGVEKDRKKAHELRIKAAANGSTVAMYMLGRDFDYGIGVDRDPESALAWYRKAAALAHARSMYRLYEVYEYGKLGQPADKAKAKEWKARAEAAMKEQGISRNALMDKLRLNMEAQE